MNDMSLAKPSGHQTRKSRQSEVPVIKFRSSCDLCTEAKVRCDKKQAQCSRCVRLGRVCRYSVSLRTGKPAIDFVKALNAGMLLMPGQQPSTAHGTTSSDAEKSIQAFLDANQNQTSGNSTKPPTPPASEPMAYTGSYEDQDLSMDFDPGRPNSSSTASPTLAAHESDICPQSGQSTPPSSLHSMDTSTLMDFFHTSADDFSLSGVDSPVFPFPPSQQRMDFDYFSSISGSQQSDCNMPVDPALQSRNAQFEHSCVRTAKCLQQSVIIMASRGDCETTQRDEHAIPATTLPATTTDQALLMCLSVSKRLVEILQCRCEADAYLPFLIAVLISKVLAAYGAIAKVDDSTPFSFGSSSSNHEKDFCQAQGQAAFMAVPLRLGAYDVDGELEGVLRVQLILHELNKFERVIQLFTDKYCQVEGGDKPGEARVIYSALGQFVTNRYERTKAACELRIPLSKPTCA